MVKLTEDHKTLAASGSAYPRLRVGTVPLGGGGGGNRGLGVNIGLGLRGGAGGLPESTTGWTRPLFSRPRLQSCSWAAWLTARTSRQRAGHGHHPAQTAILYRSRLILSSAGLL